MAERTPVIGGKVRQALCLLPSKNFVQSEQNRHKAILQVFLVDLITTEERHLLLRPPH
jgi:hypothetical protein